MEGSAISSRLLAGPYQSPLGRLRRNQHTCVGVWSAIVNQDSGSSMCLFYMSLGIIITV